MCHIVRSKNRRHWLPKFEARLAGRAINMTVRLVYLYPKWVHLVQYPDHQILNFLPYKKGLPKKALMTFLSQCVNTAFYSALLLKLFPLSLRGPRNGSSQYPDSTYLTEMCQSTSFIERSILLGPFIYRPCSRMRRKATKSFVALSCDKSNDRWTQTHYCSFTSFHINNISTFFKKRWV